MQNLIKALIITAPITALVFYYVVLRQQQIDVEFEKESLKFEQHWNEFEKDFIFTTNRKKAEERARKAEEKLKEIEKKEEERKKKLEKLEQELEKAMEETARK